MSGTTAQPTGAQPTGTPAGTARSGPAPAVPDADPAALIDSARERIDALDEQIVALVQERMTVSAGIQRARIESGGRRVHLAREMEVLDHYRAELGRPGTQLAMTLLSLCRGRF